MRANRAMVSTRAPAKPLAAKALKAAWRMRSRVRAGLRDTGAQLNKGEYPAPLAPPPPAEAYVPPPAARDVEFVIRSETDFYEPLSPYGHWEVVGPYGRCWVPTRVERDWRPYCNGYWQRTDAGWYWA